MRKGTIAITGATGFVGSRLLGSALRHGYDVVVILRRGSDISSIRDLCTRYARRVFLYTPSEGKPPPGLLYGGVLVHLASLVGPGCSPSEYMQANVAYLDEILGMCLETGVERVVYASTLLAGGEDSVAIRNPYLESKKVAERMIFERLSHRRGVDAVILRLGWTYGPGDFRHLKLLRLVERGVLPLPVPCAHMQPLFVGDAVEALLAAASVPKVPRVVLPVVGTERINVRDLLLLIAGRMGRRIRFVHIPSVVLLKVACVLDRLLPDVEASRRLEMFVRNATADIRRTSSILEWEPVVCLDEGMDLTVRWYEETKKG